MSYTTYEKPFKNPSELLAFLKLKGLIIKDEPEAVKFLGNINYFRFKAYLRPFLNLETGKYNGSHSFEDGVALYRFDEELRNYLFTCIARLEIKLRSKLDQSVTSHLDDPFWYLDDSKFSSPFQLNGFRHKVALSFQDSKDEYAVHFKSKYINTANHNFKHLPPFWIAAELTTFGSMMKLFQNIDKKQFVLDSSPNVLDTLANVFGASNLKDLNSWLQSLRDVRNRCAHHSRVWNCNVREPRGIRGLLSATCAPSHQNRLYLVTVLIKVMMENVCEDEIFVRKIDDLFKKYPVAITFQHSMGFPENWLEDPIWS